MIYTINKKPMLLLKVLKGTDDMISHFNHLIKKKGLLLLEPHSLAMDMEIVYQTGNHLNFGRVVAIRHDGEYISVEGDDGCETLMPINKLYENYSPIYYLTPIYLRNILKCECCKETYKEYLN